MRATRLSSRPLGGQQGGRYRPLVVEQSGGALAQRGGRRENVVGRFQAVTGIREREPDDRDGGADVGQYVAQAEQAGPERDDGRGSDDGRWNQRQGGQLVDRAVLRSIATAVE